MADISVNKELYERYNTKYKILKRCSKKLTFQINLRSNIFLQQIVTIELVTAAHKIVFLIAVLLVLFSSLLYV